MPEVKKERSGWRDLALNERHRQWGWDCPVVDLDFLFLEYDRGQPVAIVEYKNEHARIQHSCHPTYQALINLGTRASIPVFASRYSDDFSKWVVVPLNEFAKQHLAVKTTMTEREWVSFLYKIRGYVAPKQLLDGLTVEV